MEWGYWSIACRWRRSSKLTVTLWIWGNRFRFSNLGFAFRSTVCLCRWRQYEATTSFLTWNPFTRLQVVELTLPTRPRHHQGTRRRAFSSQPFELISINFKTQWKLGPVTSLDTHTRRHTHTYSQLCSLHLHRPTRSLRNQLQPIS